MRIWTYLTGVPIGLLLVPFILIYLTGCGVLNNNSWDRGGYGFEHGYTPKGSIEDEYDRVRNER